MVVYAEVPAYAYTYSNYKNIQYVHAMTSPVTVAIEGRNLARALIRRVYTTMCYWMITSDNISSSVSEKYLLHSLADEECMLLDHSSTHLNDFDPNAGLLPVFSNTDSIDLDMVRKLSIFSMSIGINYRYICITYRYHTSLTYIFC